MQLQAELSEEKEPSAANGSEVGCGHAQLAVKVKPGQAFATAPDLR